METTVLPGNVVKFNFPFIYLPDSTSDEPGSHGYVIYEIAPQTNLPTGTEIRNRSSIFFDFNLPILTNQVWSTIVAAIPPCTVIGTVSQNEGDIVLFPNPASGLCTIRAKSTLEEIAVTDLVGKQYLHLGPMQDRELKVDVAQWPAGIYFFRVRTSDKTEIIKFVHQ
jgi:hypothetical protein